MRPGQGRPGLVTAPARGARSSRPRRRGRCSPGSARASAPAPRRFQHRCQSARRTCGLGAVLSPCGGRGVARSPYLIARAAPMRATTVLAHPALAHRGAVARRPSPGADRMTPAARPSTWSSTRAPLGPVSGAMPRSRPRRNRTAAPGHGRGRLPSRHDGHLNISETSPLSQRPRHGGTGIPEGSGLSDALALRLCAASARPRRGPRARPRRCSTSRSGRSER